MSRDTEYLPKVVLASGAWEFICLNVPIVAAVDWIVKNYGACGVPVAVCFVFGVFNHEFPSKMVYPSLHAMISWQLVDFQISKRHGMIPNRQLHQSPGGRPAVSPFHWCS